MLQIILAAALALGSLVAASPAPEPSVQLAPGVQVN